MESLHVPLFPEAKGRQCQGNKASVATGEIMWPITLLFHLWLRTTTSFECILHYHYYLSPTSCKSTSQAEAVWYPKRHPTPPATTLTPKELQQRKEPYTRSELLTQRIRIWLLRSSVSSAGAGLRLKSRRRGVWLRRPRRSRAGSKREERQRGKKTREPRD